MFIYLDNAHFSALDDLLRRDPPGFADFLAFWLEHKCHLVVSRAHLHEIGQSADVRGVEKKLEVLRYFSLWSGAMEENVDWVVIRELLHQTLHRLRHADKPASMAYTAVRKELYRPVEHSVIDSFVRRERPGLLHELRSRQEMARFENRAITARKAYRQSAKKKNPKWDPEAWRFLPLAHRLAPSVSGDPVSDRWMAEVRARGIECWKRARRKRQALVCIYDLEGLTNLGRFPEQDLSRVGFYRALGRHWVIPYCRHAGHDPDAARAALDDFDPYDAPAISASLAVERGRKLHEKEYEASDFMDADHVLWAAYTDLAFIDKRTHGFLVQSKQNPETAKLLSPHLDVRFERAATLNDVQHHIARTASERPQRAR